MKPHGEKSGDGRECPVCGARVGTGNRHCSVPCALADRIPLGQGELPASGALLAFLVSGFVLFNQFLLGGLGWAKIQRGEVVAGDAFLTASVVIGILWAVAMFIAWMAHSPKRLGDYGVGVAAGLLLAIPRIESVFPLGVGSRLAIVNLLISIRLYRGAYYLWRASKKREK